MHAQHLSSIDFQSNLLCKHRHLAERLYSHSEVVEWLVASTVEAEGFKTEEDVESAVLGEFRYAFGQGIIDKAPLVQENAYLTLKALFLYIHSVTSVKETFATNKEFWGRVIDIAARSDAGLAVEEVFENENDLNAALGWMGERLKLIDTTAPMAQHFFVPPMFQHDVGSVGGDNGDDFVPGDNGVDGDAGRLHRDVGGAAGSVDGDVEGVAGCASADMTLATRV